MNKRSFLKALIAAPLAAKTLPKKASNLQYVVNNDMGYSSNLLKRSTYAVLNGRLTKKYVDDLAEMVKQHEGAK